MPSYDVSRVRQQFPALGRTVSGEPAVYFDGPAGSQVPQGVIDAVYRYYTECNANHGGVFATSRQSDGILDEAHRAVADLMGTKDADLVAFGANMTTLTLSLSRALSKTWQPGDEVIVSQLDHDANVTPWVLAARDAGATVHHIAVREADCTLDLEDFKAKLSPKTKLVAVGCASNAVGTVNPVAEITKLAHAVGAQVFLDAVHYAPHAAMDVTAWDCDYLACSAYKFFGPHVGVLYGKRQWMESLPVYKLRPATDELPGRWETGTQNHEGIAGVLAAVEYLAALGREVSPAPIGPPMARRPALLAAFAVISEYERKLVTQLLDGLAKLKSVRVWGITDRAKFDQRLPTVSITHAKLAPQKLAAHLADEGIFVWSGNYYALPLTQALGREPEGMVRIGFLHYNTEEEIDRLLNLLEDLE